MNPEPSQVTEHNVLTDEYTYRPFTIEEQAENDLKELAGPPVIGEA